MSENKIKFTHGKDGKISTNSGGTIFSNLFLIGAFASTNEYVNDETGFHKQYKTDTAGLEVLSLKTGEALTHLSDSINALGTMMAYVEHENIDPDTLRTYAWLISGLGELMGQVAFENIEIATELRGRQHAEVGLC